MLGLPPRLGGCTEEEEGEREVTGPSASALSLQLGRGKDEIPAVPARTRTPEALLV